MIKVFFKQFLRKLRMTMPWLLITFCTSLHAQTSTLKGRVIDSIDHTAIEAARITLTKTDDTLHRLGTVTNAKGDFVIAGLKTGNYTLKISYLGYNKLKMEVLVSGPMTDAGTLKLAPDSATQNMVEIEAHIIPMVQHGDTVQYNADAYQTNPDAELEDLLGKLPGMVLDNGSVQAQGEPITQILLDGKPYFGGDLNFALKNIAAETIDKVLVYYKQSDQAKFTGFDDGQSIKIIDIITKKDKRNGQFGKAHAGYGTNDRYMVDGNLNLFNGSRRITLVGSTANNTSGAVGGINSVNNLGVNYGDSLGKKVYLSGSYAYSHAMNNVQSSLDRTYFGSNTIYNEADASASTNLSHHINLKMECNFDSFNTLTITPAINFNTGNNSSSMSAQNHVNDTLQSQTQNMNSAGTTGYGISANVLYGHKFEKKGRTISLNVNTNINNSSGNGLLHNNSTYYSAHDSTVAFNQQLNSLSNNWTISPGINYTEPIDKRSMVQVNASTMYNKSQSNKGAYNFDTLINEYQNFDSSLSSNFNTSTLTNRAGVGYRLTGKKYSLNIGANYQNTNLSGAQEYPNAVSIHKDFSNVLPSAIFNYKFTKKSNINVSYQSSAGLPSIFQLQSLVNNTNPLQLSEGNPDLKQQYVQTMNVRFGFPVSEKNSININASGSTTAHLIANATFLAAKDSMLAGGYVLHQGSLLTRPVNLEGAYNLRANGSYALHIEKLKSNMNFNAGYTYNSVPGLVNGLPDFVNTSSINGGITLSSNIKEHLDYTLAYSPNYNIVKNTTQEAGNNNYFFQNVQFKLNWIIVKGFVLNTDMNYRAYSGLTATYNQNIITWNGSIGKKFFTKHNGEVRFYIYDILNQNTSLGHTVTDAYIQNRQANVLGRYYMLSFVYQLKNYTK